LLKSESLGIRWDKNTITNNSFRKRLANYLNRLTTKLHLPINWFDLLDIDKKEMVAPFPTTLALSLDYMSDRTLFFGTRHNGIFESIDAGKTHKKIWDGKKNTISSLVISPNFTEDKTLLASVRGLGVYKSVNGGKSWESAVNGFEMVNSWNKDVINHQITDKDIKLVISPNFKNDRTIYAGSSEGLYISQDSGENWNIIKNQWVDGSTNIIEVSLSPNFKDDNLLIVSVKGEGLFKSNDRGKSFQKFGEDLILNNHRIEFIKFSKLFPEDNTIIAASREKIFCSYDAGKQWKELKRPVRYENHRDDVIRYHGDWDKIYGEKYSAGSIHVSSTPGSYLELSFNGSGIKWKGPQSKSHGTAKIFLDGEYKTLVNQFSDKNTFSEEVYSISNLPSNSHEIKILLNDDENSSSSKSISVDAFDIIP
jgi:photosystem II stability/assembly factor-like uncharacterized protein